MSPRRSPLLLILAALTACHAAPDARPSLVSARPAPGTSTPDAARGASAPVSLDGPWRYHVGDLPYAPATLPAQLALPSMRVPSNWYKEGLDHAGVVWFFREVELDGDGSPLALRFEAVDYAADVYWDGARIGGHRGYFAPFRAFVPAGQRAGKHLLAVRVDSPIEPPSAWSLHKTLIKGVLSHHDTRPGGAWSERGQDANTGGIWGHVTLARIGAGLLDDVRVTTAELTRARARLRIEARLVGGLGGRPGGEKIGYRILGPEGAVVATGQLGPAAADGLARGEAEIADPAVWWPYELGSPRLHRIELSLEGEDRAGAATATATFGVRTVERDRKNRILVNGVPVFLRGTNYIGSLYYASFTEAEVRRDVGMMRTAHVNAVRVHAHVASPTFYRLCDEAGLLVWQDFPLQWGYDDSPAFAAEAARQAREMARSLHNHPSVIHYAAINEAPWSSDWMVWKYKDYDPDQNRLLAQAVETALREEDPSRPSQGNAHPAEHAWSGWYEGSYRDFAKATPQPIVTEFGAQAVPDVVTLRTFLKEGELWPLTGPVLETWEYHNFQMRELREVAKIPLGDSVEALVQNTQRYQARVSQFAAENLRRQKWQPVTGIFQFMFVEHWASMNWGVVDYTRRPKLGYAALTRAYQPVLVVASKKPNERDLTLHLVNDTREDLRGATILARSGHEARRLAAAVLAGEVTKVGEHVPLPEPGEELTLDVVDSGGSLLSANRYEPGYFTTEPRP